MPSEESVKSSAEGEKHKHLDREIREMVAAITHRANDFHKPGSTNNLESEDEHGSRIITLAGTNHGATLRSEMDGKSGKSSFHDGEDEALSTYVNSNFQAINNSIMFGGSYHANDPGVHMDILDFTDPLPPHKVEKHGKKEKKKEKKDKEASKSEYHSD